MSRGIFLASAQTPLHTRAHQCHRKRFCPIHLSFCPNECWHWLPGVSLRCVRLLTCTPASLGLDFLIVNDSVHEAGAAGGEGGGEKETKARHTQSPCLLSDNDKHNEDPLRLSLSFPHYEHSSSGICHHAYYAWHSHLFTQGNREKKKHTERYTHTPQLDP